MSPWSSNVASKSLKSTHSCCFHQQKTVEFKPQLNKIKEAQGRGIIIIAYAPHGLVVGVVAEVEETNGYFIFCGHLFHVNLHLYPIYIPYTLLINLHLYPVSHSKSSTLSNVYTRFRLQVNQQRIGKRPAAERGFTPSLNKHAHTS